MPSLENDPLPKSRTTDFCTAHYIDEIKGISRFLVAAPSHMLVRTYEDEFAAVKCAHLRFFHVDNDERDASFGRGFNDARDTRGWIEAKQSVVGTQCIVERTAPL